MPKNPLDWVDESLQRLEQTDLRRVRRVGINQPNESESVANSLINFSSNDYLGLANDPRLADAAATAASEQGWGAGASPVVSGRTTEHAKLEEELAQFKQTEAAILFPTGFAANAGTIPALVDEGDVIFADAKNHASLIDGCRLARAERHIYPHNDVKSLSKMLSSASNFRRKLIVTDSLFSMDGDFAPLEELGNLAEEHNAMLLVDEAHATGVFGKRGSGLVEFFAESSPRLKQQVTIRIGTLSKAFGSAGGFVAGDQKLIDWLFNRARSYVFSTAAPAAMMAAARASLRIVQEEPERRMELLKKATYLRSKLCEMGWNLGNSSSQIIPVVVETPEQALALSSRLRAAGCHVPAIRPPTVPEGESLVRISLSYSHRKVDLENLLRALKKPT